MGEGDENENAPDTRSKLQQEEDRQLNAVTDNLDDDGDQIPATQKYKGDWHKSALSKAYFKSGTPVVDELRKRGMLIEK